MLVDQQKFVEVTDILARAESRLDDIDLYIQHQTNGTLDQYYNEVLTSAIMDIALLPVHRQTEGLAPEDDDEPNTIVSTVKQIVTMTAFHFHKSIVEVEQDFLIAFKEFPTVDVREAAMLRHMDRLH
jgi:hypothetical protein